MGVNPAPIHPDMELNGDSVALFLLNLSLAGVGYLVGGKALAIAVLWLWLMVFGALWVVNGLWLTMKQSPAWLIVVILGGVFFTMSLRWLGAHWHPELRYALIFMVITVVVGFFVRVSRKH